MSAAVTSFWKSTKALPGASTRHSGSMVHAGEASSTTGGAPGEFSGFGPNAGAPAGGHGGVQRELAVRRPDGNLGLDRHARPEGGDGLVPGKSPTGLRDQVDGGVPAPGDREQVGGGGALAPLPVADLHRGEPRTARRADDRPAENDFRVSRSQGLDDRRRRGDAAVNQRRKARAGVEQGMGGAVGAVVVGEDHRPLARQHRPTADVLFDGGSRA